MTVRFVRPASHSATAARRLGLSALVLFLITALAHRFGPAGRRRISALAFFSAAIALASVPRRSRAHEALAGGGRRVGVAAARPVYAAVLLRRRVRRSFYYYKLPALHDISIDLTDAPSWVAEPKAKQQWLPRPLTITAADRRIQSIAYPGLTGRRYEGALDSRLRGRAEALVSARIGITRKQGSSRSSRISPSARPRRTSRRRCRMSRRSRCRGPNYR